MRDRGNVTVSGEIIAATSKAVLIRVGERNYWVPRKIMIVDDEESLVVGDELDFEVPSWFAEREGLE